MYHLEMIKGEDKKVFTKEFYRLKRLAAPRLDHLKMGDLTLRWWVKRSDHRRVTGVTHRRIWKIKASTDGRRPRYRWYTNLIIFDKNYHMRQGWAGTLDTFKHELAHVITKGGHGSEFMKAMRSLKD